MVGYFVGIRCEFVTPPTLHSCHTASKTQPIGFLGKWISALIFCIQNPVSCMMCSYSIFDINKTISDGGITIDLWIIKVYTSNWSSNSWGSSNSLKFIKVHTFIWNDHQIIPGPRDPLEHPENILEKSCEHPENI